MVDGAVFFLHHSTISFSVLPPPYSIMFLDEMNLRVGYPSTSNFPANSFSTVASTFPKMI